MHFVECGSFDVVHHHLAWPWIAIDLTRTHVAFASGTHEISTRVFTESKLTEGPTFKLPAEVGARAFAIAADGKLLAVVGTVDGKSVIVTLDEHGERARSSLAVLTGGNFIAHAVAFDRTGARLWISAESGEKTALVVIDAQTHAVHGVVTSAPFPPPALHELHVHPQDDAVLLVAACGQDGTFARVAGWSDGPPIENRGAQRSDSRRSLSGAWGAEPPILIEVLTALDAGDVTAGFVGFSADLTRVHLAEADELRTHAWPGLEQLSSVMLADDFASSYAGAVLGDRIFVDGEDRDAGGDSVMQFDRSALLGTVLKPPFPSGMWVGRLGVDAIVTVESKGDPARARVLRLPVPHDQATLLSPQ